MDWGSNLNDKYGTYYNEQKTKCELVISSDSRETVSRQSYD